MKVVNSPAEGAGKKKALLEDAPSANVYSQLQKLTAQNPVCEYFSSKVDSLPCFAEESQNMHSFLPATGKESLWILCETKSSVKKSDVGEKKNCVTIEMKNLFLSCALQHNLICISSSPLLDLMFCIFSCSEPAKHHPDADCDNPDRSSSTSRTSTKPSNSSPSLAQPDCGAAGCSAAEH